eukprot:GILI01018048.1.p1 GENE.GILI01018048.1~~GILI01018048.1.p1  ORF type:complete len:189 (-),score=15.14 GILI01018048.1:33-566(-)
MCRKYDPEKVVLASALAECFLKKMRSQGFIQYEDGADSFLLAEDGGKQSNGQLCKNVDDKVRGRLEKIIDMVLFRHGSTGVHKAIKKAVELRKLVPAYPVKNLNSFTVDRSGSAFPDCFLLHPRTTVREFARMLSPDIERNLMYAEGPDGRRVAGDDEIDNNNNILKFVCSESENES